MNIQFDVSPWFLLLAFLGAFAFAFIHYQKKGPWSQQVRVLLFALRFLVILILGILLMNPKLSRNFRTYEAPKMVLAIDNSASLALVHNEETLDRLKNELSTLQVQLQDQGFEVAINSFSGNKVPLDSIKFTATSSPIDALLKNSKELFEGENLHSIVLISDGLFNTGSSPLYRPHVLPIITLGIGDTLARKDIILKSLVHNKLAYQGNQFPLIAEISHNGFSKQTVKVLVEKNNQTLAEKLVQLGNDNQLTEVQFVLDAKENGLQHYIVRVQVQPGEFTEKNNSLHAYVEVIDGKQKVLLAAQSPHPDIKAIKSAIEQNQNYEVRLYIPGIHTFKQDDYSLVIFHQLPAASVNDPALTKLQQSKVSKWWIVGKQTTIPQLNQQNPLLEIQQLSSETDKVRPFVNPVMSLFIISDEHKQIITKFPPALAPFGKLIPKAEFQVVLQQQIGNVKTERPLLITGTDEDYKYAILLAEGSWTWRLDEFMQHEKTEAFDELILKTVQYLSTKDDRSRFRFYPIKPQFADGEAIQFVAETYNQVFEKIYEKDIQIEFTNEAGSSTKYSFVTAASNSRFRINQLPQGVYKYKASTELDGKTETVRGEFNVLQSDLESLQLQADHDLLRRLSAQSSGQFFNSINGLAEYLKQQEAQSLVHNQVRTQSILHQKWIFFLIITLLTAEWIIRKYYGSY